MVVLALVAALVAAVVAEARAGPVAAEDLPVTPLVIPLATPLVVPAPAPRSTLTEVMVCPEPQEEIFKSQNKSRILLTDHLIHCLLVCSLSPQFLLQFSFFSFNFCTRLFHSVVLSVPPFIFSANHLSPVSVIFLLLVLLHFVVFPLEIFLLLLSIYYCPLTLLCVSL